MQFTELGRWKRRWIRRFRALLRRADVDRELDEELAFHLEAETARNVDAGMDREEAARQARLAFGGIQKHRAETRDARWLAWLPDLSLDFKLGGRMLFKYPVITLVGGLAMAFAICVGAVTFEMVRIFLHPSLPLPDGHRIVQIRNWDVQGSSVEPRSLYDFTIWRGAVKSVTDIGAYRDVTRNLVGVAGDAHAVQVAEITASAFRIAPARPQLGRTLVEGDERAGAPPVVVLGYAVWRTEFAGAPDVVGRRVQLGDTHATIVGVMPEGFAFPISHEVWTPLHAQLFDQAPRAGPEIVVFGRLAAGITLRQAQAELAVLGRRTAADHPATHGYLHPQVKSYTSVFWDPAAGDLGIFVSIPVFALMLLILVCGNVALLLFARAATRENEILVRSALGASQARIVTQLVAEALVLATVAAVIGLAAAHFGLQRWGLEFLRVGMGQLPFWFNPHLSLATVLYAIGLTGVAAAIAGVVPGLKVTSGMAARLRQAAAGGGGLTFGGVWTVVIVSQVAFTTAFPVVAYIEQRELAYVQSASPGFRAEQYLAVRVDMDAATLADTTASATREARARYTSSLQELRRRVAAEPGIAGVTFVDRLPRDGHIERLVEVDDPSSNSALAPDSAGSRTAFPEASTARIDPSYFEVLQAPLLEGRGFHGGDLMPESRVVVVDEGFVREVLHGHSAVGRRVRFVGTPANGKSPADEPRPWYTIVGVVKELGMRSATQHSQAAGIYFPATPGNDGASIMIVHAQGDPTAFGSRVRTLATAVDPTVRLSDLQRVDQVTSGPIWFIGLWLRATVLLTAIALLLSLAGIYAVMSFTVSRRTREIGIRVALGSTARRVVVSIFRRPLAQVGIGVAAGGALSGLMLVATTGGAVSASGVALLLLYSTIILGVCLLACVFPTARALSIEPVDALRSE